MNNTYEKVISSIISAAPDGESNNDTIFQERCRRLWEMNDPNFLPTFTLTELFDMPCKSNPPLIDKLLYTGTYLFVGAPKVGKSFLMAQISYHVSNGFPLWGYPVRQGAVLYMALEDGQDRLKKRLYRMFGMEAESTNNLYFAINSKQIFDGLEGQLTEFIRQHPDTRMIIIDTMQKVRNIGGERYSYANDYEIVTKLKRFSDSYGICVLLVHHTRKQSAEDCFDTISGTNGLLGAADGAFLLQKDKRTDNRASLDIAGRDQPDQRLYLEFDRERCIWQFVKTEIELWNEPPDPVLEAVARIISAEMPEWFGTASELINCLNQVELSPNALTRRLNIAADRLLAEYGIFYESSRNHTGRHVKLSLDKFSKRDDGDDGDDILEK